MKHRHTLRVLHITITALIIAVISATTPLLLQSYAAVPDELKERIEQKAAELEKINEELEKNEQRLQAEARRGRTLKAEVNRLDRTIQSTELGIRRNQVTIEKLTLELEKLQEDIATKEEDVVLRKQATVELLQDFQARENQSLLVTFLSNQSLADTIAEAQSIFDLNNGILTEIAKIKQLKAELGYKLNEISGKKLSIEQEKRVLEVRRGVATDQKKSQSELLAETKEKEAAYQRIVQELEEKQQSINDEINEIEEELRRSVDPESLPNQRAGVLGWPTKNPYLTQEYGRTAFAQRTYKSKFHNGIDLRAKPSGTPIYAAEAGVVTHAGNNGRIQYGKFILIEHDNNLSTLYAHLSRHGARKGERVKRGDIIGYSGNTGYSFATHLHFVVYVSQTVLLKNFPGAGLIPVGTTLNPMDYLPQ